MRLGYILIFIAAFFTDRITKSWALNNLASGDLIISPGLNLTLSYNRGISFGLFHSYSSIVFYTISLIIFIALTLFVFYMIAEYRDGRGIVAELLVLSGGISNMLDRFMYGGVVDFIDLYVSTWHWYTFNFADVFVVSGVIFILLRSIKDVYFGES